MKCRYVYIGPKHYRRLLGAFIKHGKVSINDACHDYLYFANFDGDAVEAYACLTCDRRFQTTNRLRRRETQ